MRKRKYVIGVGDVVTATRDYGRMYNAYKDRVGTVTEAIATSSGQLIFVKFWDDPDDQRYFMDFDFKRIAKAKHDPDPDPTTLPEG